MIFPGLGTEGLVVLWGALDRITTMEDGRSTQSEKGKETAELLARLTLQEEEEDEFVWEEELPDLTEPAKWLAIAKVHTPKTFSPNALYGDMRAAWNPAKTVVWRKIRENLFSAQFGCLADSSTCN